MTDTNEIIAHLWEDVYDYWQDVADELKTQYGIKLSSEACRARYRRFSESRDRNPVYDQKSVSGLEYKATEGSSEIDPDVVSDLREQFGVGDEFVPKKIRTTSTDDRIWRSVEWVREPVTENKLEAILEQIKEHAPDYSRWKPSHFDKGENLLIPILYDAHINKRTSLDERHDSYHEVAIKLIEKAKNMNYSFDKILLIIGNDFGNIDNPQGGTTAGTPQDTLVHWSVDIDLRCYNAVAAIEAFSSHADTDIIMIPGNHDKYSNHWLGKVIQSWFKDNKRVVVRNNGERSREYYSWKNNMWGFAHGNEENSALYPALMATEAPKEFSNAKYREMFVGHFHQKRNAFYPLNENHGVTVRWMPALSAPDDWHKLKGYVGAKQQALGIIYNEDGYDCEFAVNVR